MILNARFYFSHETSSRKRRYCTICQQDFSDRYFRRHTCEEKAENISQPTQSKCDEPILLPASEPEMENFENQMEESDMEEEFLMGHLSSSSSDSTSEEEVLDTELFNEFYLDNIEHRENESEKQSVDIQGGYQNYVIAVLKILLVWQVVHYVSDAAFSVLLFLLRSLFYVFSFSSDLAKSFYQSFPVTMYQLHKYISFEKDDFEKYVVCPKCHCLYEFQDCCHLVEGIQTSKLCSNVVMPNHVMSHYRRPCGELLLKSINVGGKKKLIARKTYCYKSLKLSLQRLVNRKDFEETCELWRFREVPHDVFNDVYDGEIWQKFNGLEYNFFTSERNYGVMMNVDWFQPFKYSNYSIGAIYLTILNLPREERFKKKNMILVGLIPDMKSEPPTNSFIEPLVEELREAWHGFSLKSYKSKTPVIFKLVLLCVGCDIPASRKLCGFLGHGATRGCNKCMKQFEGGIGEKSYAGFNFSEWEMRDAKSHRDIVRKIVKSKTKGKRENLEKFYGVRYSVLLELDYFDPIRMTIIDPMHNLFLGTAKRVLNLWIDYKVLSADDLKQMQARVEKVHCPSDIGKLPEKFASSFGSFNAYLKIGQSYFQSMF